MVIPSSFSSPVLADKYIQSLQEALDTLAWLEFVYPAARLGVDDDGKTYPMSYRNNDSDKNYNLLLDTDVKACSYFEVDGSVGIGDGNFNGGDEDMTIPLSLVVWGRLDKIYPAKKYDYTSELIQDVVNILKYCANTSGYRINALTGLTFSTDYNDVFGRYSAYDEQEWRGTMRRMTAFRVDFTLVVDSACELSDGTSPIVVSSSIVGLRFINGVAVTTFSPTIAQIESDVGMTAAQAGNGYIVRIKTPPGYSEYIDISTDGTSWFVCNADSFKVIH